METNQTSWRDIDIYVGGEKIHGIACTDLSSHVSDHSATTIYDALNKSFSCNLKVSKKTLRELRKMVMERKQRLPRKIKKRLKKRIIMGEIRLLCTHCDSSLHLSMSGEWITDAFCFKCKRDIPVKDIKREILQDE